MDFIKGELPGVSIASTSGITVSGGAATEVFVAVTYTAALAYKYVAVYAPHNNLLFKFHPTFRDGDPLESRFLASFQQPLSSAQFTP